RHTHCSAKAFKLREIKPQGWPALLHVYGLPSCPFNFSLSLFLSLSLPLSTSPPILSLQFLSLSFSPSLSLSLSLSLSISSLCHPSPSCSATDLAPCLFHYFLFCVYWKKITSSGYVAGHSKNDYFFMAFVFYTI